MKKTTRMYLVIVLMVFALGLACGVTGAGETTLLDTNQAGSLAKGGDIVPLNSQSKMLQFRSGGHILGFQPTKTYLASLDHALSVEFLHTKGVMPQSTTGTTTANSLTKAPELTKVLYENLWKGINLTYETTQDGITESTYHIAPNADVSQIRLRYNVPLKVQKDGSLKFTFERGYLTESKPVAWQDINGKRIPVTVAFYVSGDEVGFSVGTYNPREPLIIDPTYAWHTFYETQNYSRGIAVDTGGNIYVTGNSPDWGTPLHAHSGNGDIFVLKLNSSGAYQWHTFYGSSNWDQGYGIAVDTGGNIYVTGSSEATWGSPLNPHSGGSDIFVLKLNSNGVYQWHTFYGHASFSDIGYGITLDTGGNIYVSGHSPKTWGTPLKPHSGDGESDIVVLKLDNDGAYQWHTFYGGIGEEYILGYGIAVDTGGNIYVTGTSEATWGSPLHAHTGDAYGGDIFVLKLNSNGAYQWHTFYGASDNIDYGYSTVVDTGGNVYVMGGGSGWGTPLHGEGGIFVMKLNSSGAYQWHTFGGQFNPRIGYGIAIDTGGNIYVATTSSIPWGSPLHAHTGDASGDIFVMKLNSSGAYQWHTYYGAGGLDACGGIAVDTGGNAYVTGNSWLNWGTPLHALIKTGDTLVLKLAAIDIFTFTDQTSVSLNTVTTSNVITVSGIIVPAAISITGGEYSVSTDGGTTWSAYSTTTPATVSLNNQVRVLQVSSPNEATTTNTTLTIGGISDTFSVTTLDATPDTLTFTDQTGVSFNTVITSNVITVSGISIPVSISITGGEYSVSTDGGTTWSAYSTTMPATVSLNNLVRVRLTSSSSYSTTTSATLTIGGVSDTFSVSTIDDTVPEAFSFTDRIGVPLNTVTISNAITVSGINTSAAISITGGEYSVSTDGGTTWSAYSTTTPATVSLNNQVRVLQVSSPNEATTTNTTLTIGGISDTFSVTTMQNPALLVTITVDPNPDSLNAPWTLTGPNAFSLTFNGDTVIGDLQTGTYTLTWGNVTGCDKPVSRIQTLYAGDSITFTGNYQLTPVVPTPPTNGTQGSNITINGSNFGATQGSGYVDFNGIHGAIVSWSNTQIVVTVPYGATLGCMRIVTDYGTSGCMYPSIQNPACFPPAKLSNTEYFNIAQGAYDNVADGNAVLLQAGTLSENVTLDRNITTTLKGGYNCPYDTQSSYTTIDGSLTIKNGTVTVEGLIIK